MTLRLPRGVTTPQVVVMSALFALALLGNGVAELVAHRPPAVASTLASVFQVNSEDGPLAGLLLQASAHVGSRRVGVAALILASVALSWLGAFALGSSSQEGNHAWTALLLTALLTVGWADWRILLEQWRALLAGGFISSGLALQARRSGSERPRAGSMLASGVLFGLALLTRHAIWPCVLPTLFWLLRGNESPRRAAGSFALGLSAACLASLALAVATGATADYARWLLTWDWAAVPIATRPAAQLLSDAGLLSFLWLIPVLPVLGGSESRADRTSPAARFTRFALGAWLLMFWPLAPFPSGSILTSLLALAPAFGCLLASLNSGRAEHFPKESIGARLGARWRVLPATLIVSLLLLGRASALDFDAHRSPIERQADLFE